MNIVITDRFTLRNKHLIKTFFCVCVRTTYCYCTSCGGDPCLIIPATPDSPAEPVSNLKTFVRTLKF